MITKTEVFKSSVGSRKGWAFAVYYDDREYANFVSSLSKTKKTATSELDRYVRTGDFSLYGDAE